MERNLVHGPGDVQGEPFRLPGYLRRFLYRLYAVDPSGRRIVRRALLGVAKGNMKTELMAAVGLAELAGPVAPKAPEVRIAAASFDQADILFGTAKVMVEEGPLKDRFHVFDTEIIPKDQPGVLKRIAAAAGTKDGGRTTCYIADELHEWTGPKARNHLVNSNSLAKRANGLELNISTAGADRDSLLGTLYDYGRRLANGEEVNPRFLFEWWESVGDWNLDDEGELRAALREANPASDDIPALLDSAVARYHDPDVPAHEFARYFLNRWTPPPARWLSSSNIEAARRSVLLPPDGAPVVLGFDGSATRDWTSLALAPASGPCHIHLLGNWERNPHDPDWRVPRAEVDARVADAFRRWDVRVMVGDPAGWTSELQAWADEYGEERVLVIPQTAERMAPAADVFRAELCDGRLTVDDHPALVRALGNAVTRETRWGLSISKDARNSVRKIDPAIAAILARMARDLIPATAERHHWKAFVA
jgi:phage terminase large subunit-like protein